MVKIKTVIRLNPNKELVNLIKEGLLMRGGYCPCMLDANEDTKCMCKAFKEMEEGVCHCGLYIKEKVEGN